MSGQQTNEDNSYKSPVAAWRLKKRLPLVASVEYMKCGASRTDAFSVSVPLLIPYVS